MKKAEIREEYQKPKSSMIVRCFGSKGTGFIVIIVSVILLFLLGIFLYRKLKQTQVELESCRSSSSSEKNA